MATTRIVACNPITIPGAGSNSGAILHEEYGDAEALTFFAPAGVTSVTLQASPVENPTASDWYTVISGITPVVVTTGGPCAVCIIPPAAKALRIVAGTPVSGDKIVPINKMYIVAGG